MIVEKPDPNIFILKDFISKEEQDIILKNKLDNRLKYNILIDESLSPDDYLENQALIYDLCSND